MTAIKKLLIANRGEIVGRIIRTCRQMGLATTAVYSEADRKAVFPRLADSAVLIGPANPLLSYLNIEAIIQAARQTGAEAIHPGYGFLSERGAFAEAVEEAGLIWVGPSSRVLRAISSKCYCRQLADRAGVPIIPGTLYPTPDAQAVATYGRQHGWPIFLKLDKGGGGKGIEKISGEDQAAQAFQRAESIGRMAFGSGAGYIEQVVPGPRHIEVQFLADRHGQCLCLGERECSVQRRYQKIIEEAPSMVVTPGDRARLFDWTRRLVQEMGYHGAGTIEGLRSENGDYYFMEINARLQVEHPVTEMLTGMDLVRQQLLIASGEKMDFSQDDVQLEGHAIEARVYAEDPDTFMPSPGTVTGLSWPAEDANLRIDHVLDQGVAVPPYYDPLLAKVIARDRTREAAARRLSRALGQIRIEGVKTSIPVNLKILEHPAFLEGRIDTGFYESKIKK